MLKRAWIVDLEDAGKLAWSELRRFWVQDIWPVLMTLGIFGVFAAPFIVLILILWYLQSIGWRPAAGFYTIGMAAQGCAQALMG